MLFLLFSESTNFLFISYHYILLFYSLMSCICKYEKAMECPVHTKQSNKVQDFNSYLNIN